MRSRNEETVERRKTSVRRALRFAALQLLIAAVLLEAVLRVIGPRTAIRHLLYEPSAATSFSNADTVEELLDQSLLGFRPRTESYGFVLNSKSLRTKEYTEQKPAGVFRVLAFGDSFTWASGALPHEQHWTVILEEQLRKRRWPEAEVLRMGVPATGPDFQYRLWQIEGSRLDPDVVVQAFFVGNDFVDHRGALSPKGLRPVGRIERIADHWLSLRAATNLLRVIRGVVRDQGGKEPTSGDGTTYDEGGYSLPAYAVGFQPRRPSFKYDKYIQIESRRMALCLNENEAGFELLLDRVAATLEAFHREVSDRGARFVVMIIPDEYQVDPGLAAEIVSIEERNLDEYDLGRPARRLGEVLHERGIEVFDVSPEFIARGRDRRLYRVQDTHWNRNGNRLAGALLGRLLANRGFTGSHPSEPELISASDWEDGRLVLSRE